MVLCRREILKSRFDAVNCSGSSSGCPVAGKGTPSRAGEWAFV